MSLLLTGNKYVPAVRNEGCNVAVILFTGNRNCHCNTVNFIDLSFCLVYWQKQSAGGVLQNKCSKRFHKIHRKTPASESLF